MSDNSIYSVEPKDVTPEIAGSLALDNSGGSVEGKGDFSAFVYLENRTGKSTITGRNTGSVGRYDFVALYEGEVPSDPNSGYLDYFYMAKDFSKVTSRKWGVGLTAAYVSYNYRSGKYVVLAKTPQTA